MNDYGKYLLRTDEQLDAFRRKYAGYIEANESEYISWFNSLPLMEWRYYLTGVPQENIPVFIGMLCHLHCAWKINVSFSRSMTMICRDPLNVEEWQSWIDSHRPKVKRPRTDLKNL